MTFGIDSKTSMTFKNKTEKSGKPQAAKVVVCRSHSAGSSIEIVQANGDVMVAVVDAEQLDALAAALRGEN